MKYSVFYILLLDLLLSINSVLPNWDLKKSSVDLLKDEISISVTISEKNMYDMRAKIVKIISKENNEIKVKKELYINDDNMGTTEWEGIESCYLFNKKKYICPTGRNHMHVYTDGLYIMEPTNFNYDGDWDLKCYFHSDYMFVAYTNHFNIFYAIKIKEEYAGWNGDTKMYDGLFDFKWTTTEEQDGDNVVYPMKFLTLHDKRLELKGTKFTVKSDKIDRSDVSTNILLENVRANTYAYFDETNDNFYYISYSSVSDFKSGYYNGGDIPYNSVDSISIIKYNKSPLEFIDDVTINYMKFIPHTKFVYYEITNNKKGINYHGIIDIILNKVIFNTNETILQFFPYLDNSMVAITSESAYKICPISDSSGNCISSCPDNNLIISTFNKNYCGNCENIIFKPNEICVDYCDETIYFKSDNICGLCKDINTQSQYKLINSTGCKENSCPEGAIEYNTDLHICICNEEEGYYFDGENCISQTPKKCHPYCNDCTSYSDDNNEQNCISCNESLNFVLEGSNCKEKCSDKYFETDNKKCMKCDESCKTCFNSSNNCTSCEEKRFLDDNNNCADCSDICENCSEDSKKCISCDKNSEYKYFVEEHHTCVDICPNNTKKKKKSFKCVSSNNNDDEDESNYILWIYIILIAILLLIISICLCKKHYNQKTDSSSIENNLNSQNGSQELIKN